MRLDRSGKDCARPLIHVNCRRAVARKFGKLDAGLFSATAAAAMVTGPGHVTETCRAREKARAVPDAKIVDFALPGPTLSAGRQTTSHTFDTDPYQGAWGLSLSNRKSVFVVDDDPSVLKALQRVLQVHGYDCSLFSSAEAIESHEDFGQAICIIMDIELNGASGIEVRCRLRNAGISAPVIYLTGSNTPVVREAALKSGCHAYLTKPVSAQSLIEEIRKVTQGLSGRD